MFAFGEPESALPVVHRAAMSNVFTPVPTDGTQVPIAADPESRLFCPTATDGLHPPDETATNICPASVKILTKRQNGLRSRRR